MAHYAGHPQYPPNSYGSNPPNYSPQQNGPPPYPPQQYQQPPYQQPPYGQPGYQPNSGYQTNGPPQHGHQNHDRPPKRQKSNPVITRYAPPPGYRPPPPGQPYATAPSYSQPNYGPSHGPPPPPPPQNWQQPPSYQQNQGWQPPPNYQQPPNPQPGHSGNYPPYPHQPPQSWQPPQANYSSPPPPPPPPNNFQQPPPPPPYPPQPGHAGPTPPPNYPPPNQPWQAPPSQQRPFPPSNSYQPGPPGPPSYGQGPPPTTPSSSLDGMQPHHQGAHRQGSRSSATQESARPSVGGMEIIVVDEKDRINYGHNDPFGLRYLDWDFDFDGPIWPKSNEDIDQALSIGIIIWHPATLQTRALSCEFHEAEEISHQPLPKAYGNGESVSRYFTTENSHEAFLDIRQTDEWSEIEGDRMFHQIPESDLVPLQVMIANLRRPDEDDHGKLRLDIDRVLAIASGDPPVDIMDTSDGPPFSDTQNDAAESQPPPQSQAVGPTSFSRDDRQEDVLALLGVTGTPKPVYPTPGPARPQKADGSPPRPPSSSADHGSIEVDQPAHQQTPFEPPESARSSISQYGPRDKPMTTPPPPEQMERSPSPLDPWRASNHNGARVSPARSSGSQHTVAGSDFGGRDYDPGKIENQQQSKSTRTDSSSSRKRSYEDVENDANDARLKQLDDMTPRLKRRQPRVEAAYSRR